MNNSSYREMLRNRVPKVVGYALKWCKAKERWLDHVYNNFVGIYVHKKDRKSAARTCLGIREGKPKWFEFHESIMWDQFGMSEDEKEYWLWVEGWVNWFKKNFQVINNDYKTSKMVGKENMFKDRLREYYLKNTDEGEREKLVNFIMNCLEN
jgi:hypothetical protein